MRARRSSPLTTTERFKNALEILSTPPATTSGRWVVVPENSAPRRDYGRRRTQRQRALLFHLLLAAVPVTLGSALLAHGAWWEIHIATDFALALYVAFLVEARRRRSERRTKVRSIAAERSARRAAAARRVEASGGRR